MEKYIVMKAGGKQSTQDASPPEFFLFFSFFFCLSLPLCGSVNTFSSSQRKCSFKINRACVMNSAAFRATSRWATGATCMRRWGARRARFLYVRLRRIYLFGGKIKENAKKENWRKLQPLQNHKGGVMECSGWGGWGWGDWRCEIATR